MNIIEEFGLDEDRFVWQDLSMCQNFPGNAHFEDAESHEGVYNAVREVCGYCPVAEMCFETGMETRSQGIWGGRKIARGKVIE